MSLEEVSASKRLRIDPNVTVSNDVISVPTTNINDVQSSDIFMNSTYLGIIIEFIPLMNLFRTLFAINKFINHFIHNNNNINIIKRMVENEFQLEFVKNSDEFQNSSTTNEILLIIKECLTTTHSNSLCDLILKMPNKNLFKYFIKNCQN